MPHKWMKQDGTSSPDAKDQQKDNKVQNQKKII